MHILLLEPDRLQANVCRQAMVEAGYTFAHATTAQRGVSLADERVPDVVVLELQLSSHNGVEFLYEFRSYTEWLHIPVVLYTFVQPEVLAHAATLQTELGVQRILYKPTTTLAELLAAVEQVVLATI